MTNLDENFTNRDLRGSMTLVNIPRHILVGAICGNGQHDVLTKSIGQKSSGEKIRKKN
jgi:hypothetical protein